MKNAAWYKELLEAQFPRLIHCCISGFGADGPMGGLPGYDAANGNPAGDPTRIGVPIVDLVTGLNATIGILLALQERARNGKGQSIDVALYGSAISVLHPYTPNYLYSGRVPQRSGNTHPNISPYDSYKTRTAPIFLAVGNDRQFEKLVVLLGQADLAQDPRFKTNPDRVRARDELKLRYYSSICAYFKLLFVIGACQRRIRRYPCTSVSCRSCS